MMLVIAVVGSKSSGKTRTIELLVKHLSQRGFKIATVKHIPEKDFSIDTKGKDTWRHSEAGAKTVLSVAPKEVAVIMKMNTENLGLNQIVGLCEDADVVILEGFKDLVAKNPSIYKIVAVKDSGEILEACGKFKSIIAFSGFGEKEIPEGVNQPYFNLIKDSEKIGTFIEKIAEASKGKIEDLRLYVHGTIIQVNPFVQKIISRAVLAMVSTLKNVELSGDEVVTVKIKRR